MDIKLCQNLSENNIINKTIQEIATATAVIKGALSVENPRLILTYNASLQDINYLKIPELHRNYYITDVINLTGGRYEIQAKSDVLESFKNDKKNPNLININATIIVERQSQKKIVIGEKGSKIKEIGRLSRIDIAKFLGLLKKQKKRSEIHFSNWKTGNDLCSRNVSIQVFSALKVLTSVFGMCTGGHLC